MSTYENIPPAVARYTVSVSVSTDTSWMTKSLGLLASTSTDCGSAALALAVVWVGVVVGSKVLYVARARERLNGNRISAKVALPARLAYGYTVSSAT